MNDVEGQRVLTAGSGSRGWLQRAVLTVAAGLFLVSAFFFITIALIAGALLAVGIAVRWWWLVRRVRAARQASGPLEGQYTVVEHADTPELHR